MSEVKEPVKNDVVILEGMYKGIVGKMEEVKVVLDNELKFSSTQQLSSYEALTETVGRSIQSVLSELKYLSQQNSAIFEAEETARKATVEEILSSVNEKLDALLATIREQMETQAQILKEETVASMQVFSESAIDYDLLAEKLAEKMTGERMPAEEAFDYGILAEKIVSILPETDYDLVAEKVGALLPETDYDAIADRVVSLMPQIDYDLLAEKVAASVVPVDYDLIAEHVIDRMKGANVTTQEETVVEETPVEAQEYAQTQAPEVIYTEEASAEESREESSVEETVEEEVREEVAAEQPAIIQPSIEIDYEMLAEKVTRKLTQVIPIVDADEIVKKIQEEASEDKTDYTAISALVAAAVIAQLPQAQTVDQDAIAASVAESVNKAIADEFEMAISEEGMEQIAQAVAQKLDYNAIAERVAELLRADDGDLARIAEIVTIPVEEEVSTEEPVQQVVAEEITEEPAQQEELAISDETDDRIGIEETVNDPAMTLRYKRSFIAKITQSDEDVKYYYSEVKNAFLSYERVHSQVSWSNDRFNLGRETIAKIGIRGKTLCVYFALNADDYPITVYHQKFAGDTKMYEKTPMMVKIKSGVALKRAIRLIEMLMDRFDAEVQELTPVDYTKMYTYKTDEQLLEEGLIKTTMVEKVELDF